MFEAADMKRKEKKMSQISELYLTVTIFLQPLKPECFSSLSLAVSVNNLFKLLCVVALLWALLMFSCSLNLFLCRTRSTSRPMWREAVWWRSQWLRETMRGRFTLTRCSRKSWMSSPCAMALNPYTRPWRKLSVNMCVCVWICKFVRNCSIHPTGHDVSWLCACAGKSNQEILKISVFVYSIYRPVRVCVCLCVCVVMWWAGGGVVMNYKQHAN